MSTSVKKKDNKQTNIFVKIGRMIKIRHLILLIMLLLVNSYAWFIFSTKVKLGITAHIASWSINFTSEDGEQVTYMTFHVDKAYPGMPEARETLNISNSGTEPAFLSYDIQYVRIFNTVYEQDDTTTSQELELMLKNDFPFKFDFVRSSETIDELSGRATFDVTLNWDYESGDDELDTTWGEQAYSFYAVNPTENAIEIRLEVQAIQQVPDTP